jgi:tetratricopeptide (TPR) repeat protein
MLAYSAGKYEDSYKYMNVVYELKPSYLWLYAYELGITELQKGDAEKAEMFAKALYNSNIELPDAYVLYSSIERMTGNSKKAIEWADKGIKAIPDDAEVYRMKAMALAAKGDYEEAKKAVEKGLENQEYSYIYMVELVIENELGNKDRVKEIKEIMKEEGLEIPERTNKYLKGKISAKEMFTEGTGDVE